MKVISVHAHASGYGAHGSVIGAVGSTVVGLALAVAASLVALGVYGLRTG
jgi:hypothetical protein